MSHNRIAEQEVEIKWLKKALTTEKATKTGTVEGDATTSSHQVEALTSTGGGGSTGSYLIYPVPN